MIKNFTLRGIQLTEIERFYEYRDKNNLSSAEALKNCLDSVVNNSKPNVSNAQNESLHLQINQLKDEIEILKHEKQKISDSNFQTGNDLSEALTHNQALTEKISELQENTKINPPAFVFDPLQYPGLKEKMQRCITFEIKKGNLKKSDPDLPNQFTAKAIKYLIKEEYNHIQK